MYHLLLCDIGGYRVNQTKISLSELWALLRYKEKKIGIDILSLTERDIFQAILHLQGKKDKISLEQILEVCPHPRATFFRCLKKLRSKNIVLVTKDIFDARKSYISIQEKFNK